MDMQNVVGLCTALAPVQDQKLCSSALVRCISSTSDDTVAYAGIGIEVQVMILLLMQGYGLC